MAAADPLGPFLSITELAAYSGLSVRTLRRIIASDSPFPIYQPRDGKLLVSRPQFDAWMLKQQVEPERDVEDVAAADEVEGLVQKFFQRAGRTTSRVAASAV